MTNPLTGSTDYLSQMNEAVPSTSEALRGLDDYARSERKAKITQVMNAVLENLQSLDQSNLESLGKIHRLITKADGMQLLSSPAREVAARLFPSDLTVVTRDGEVKVNSRLLKAESQMFQAMLSAGMKEAATHTIKLENYSSETVRTLFQCLNASSPEEIPLPGRDDIMRELIDLSMKYGFGEAMEKLMTLLPAYIRRYPERIAQNNQAWLDLLLPYALSPPLASEEGKQELARRSIRDMTPTLLQSLGITEIPAVTQGKFEISMAHIEHFFDPEMRDLLQVLPVALTVQDERDLAQLKQACEQARLDSPLTLHLVDKMGMTDQQEAILRASVVGRGLPIVIKIEGQFPQGSKVFGQREWERYWGKVGEVPAPPKEMLTAALGPCPLVEGKKMWQTHVFFYRPATIYGKSIDTELIKSIVESEKFGHNRMRLLDMIRGWEDGDIKAVDKGYWCAIAKDREPVERKITYVDDRVDDQFLFDARSKGYSFPPILDAFLVLSMTYVASGERKERLLKDEQYTLCKEKGLKYPLLIGNFNDWGELTIKCSFMDKVLPWRKFEEK